MLCCFCSAPFHTQICLGSAAGEPHICLFFVQHYKAAIRGYWTLCAHGCRGRREEYLSTVGPVVVTTLSLPLALTRATCLSFNSNPVIVAFSHYFCEVQLFNSCILLRCLCSAEPLSLICFIHPLLFSINTFPLSPPWWIPLYCIYINSPFVVPIVIISPAALSFLFPSRSISSLPCVSFLPACLHPYCRVESSCCLPALSRLTPVRVCPDLITRQWR